MIKSFIHFLSSAVTASIALLVTHSDMVDPGRRICALPLQYIFVTWTRIPGLRKATNPVSMSFCRATKSFCIRYWMALSKSFSVTAKRYPSLVTKFGWVSALPVNTQSNRSIAIIDIFVLILCPYLDCLPYQQPIFGVGCIGLFMHLFLLCLYALFAHLDKYNN